jgi:hypothetical protein
LPPVRPPEARSGNVGNLFWQNINLPSQKARWERAFSICHAKRPEHQKLLASP